jgi:hypothetical protein
MHIVDELRGQLEAARSIVGNYEFGRTAVARGIACLTSEELEAGIAAAKADVLALETRIAEEAARATG